MTYEELKKALQEWIEKVLNTKEKEIVHKDTVIWVNKDHMISDITRIIEEGFI